MCMPVSHGKLGFPSSPKNNQKKYGGADQMDTANGVSWAAQNATARADAIALENQYLEAMRELAPDTGAYINEVRPCLSAGPLSELL